MAPPRNKGRRNHHNNKSNNKKESTNATTAASTGATATAASVHNNRHLSSSISAAAAALPPDARFACVICFEAVRKPVVTQCGHLFCWTCLYDWLKPSVTTEERQALFDASTDASGGSDSASATLTPPRPQPTHRWLGRPDGRRQCPVCKAPCTVLTVAPIFVQEQSHDDDDETGDKNNNSTNGEERRSPLNTARTTTTATTSPGNSRQPPHSSAPPRPSRVLATPSCLATTTATTATIGTTGPIMASVFSLAAAAAAAPTATTTTTNDGQVWGRIPIREYELPPNFISPSPTVADTFADGASGLGLRAFGRRMDPPHRLDPTTTSTTTIVTTNPSSRVMFAESTMDPSTVAASLTASRRRPRDPESDLGDRETAWVVQAPTMSAITTPAATNTAASGYSWYNTTTIADSMRIGSRHDQGIRATPERAYPGVTHFAAASTTTSSRVPRNANATVTMFCPSNPHAVPFGSMPDPFANGSATTTTTSSISNNAFFTNPAHQASSPYAHAPLFVPSSNAGNTTPFPSVFV